MKTQNKYKNKKQMDNVALYESARTGKFYFVGSKKLLPVAARPIPEVTEMFADNDRTHVFQSVREQCQLKCLLIMTGRTCFSLSARSAN
jgi:hypothetical protein